MKLLLVLLGLLWGSSSMAVPVLSFNGNEVVGVENIQVGGQTFSVEFKDGAFLDLYPEGIDPVFSQSVSHVVEAADQIGEAFATSALFSDADQIRGCESALLAPLGSCGILFPFDVFGEFAINALFGVDDMGGIFYSAFDAFAAETQNGAGPGPLDVDNLVFAVVTRAPEPATLFLIVMGLAGLGVGMSLRGSTVVKQCHRG